MTKYSTAVALLIGLSVGITGCQPDATSAAGFRLPDGDAAAGRDAFLDMQCNQCHTIANEELPPVPGFDAPFVELGGTVSKVKTYGGLVTSIINPSHKLAEGYPDDLVSEDGVSKMYVYNDYMTVQELTDLVMFLQPHYKVKPPEYYYPI